jgi:hypothetical protein
MPYQARHAQQGVRPEDLRIEERVINATADHVDLPRTLDGPYPYDVVIVDIKVRTGHKLYPHALGQVAVLVIGQLQMPGVSTTISGSSPGRRLTEASIAQSWDG